GRVQPARRDKEAVADPRERRRPNAARAPRPPVRPPSAAAGDRRERLQRNSGQLEKLATARRICGASCVQTAGAAATATTAVPRKPLTMQAISLYRAPVVVA